MSGTTDACENSSFHCSARRNLAVTAYREIVPVQQIQIATSHVCNIANATPLVYGSAVRATARADEFLERAGAVDKIRAPLEDRLFPFRNLIDIAGFLALE